LPSESSGDDADVDKTTEPVGRLGQPVNNKRGQRLPIGLGGVGERMYTSYDTARGSFAFGANMAPMRRRSASLSRDANHLARYLGPAIAAPDSQIGRWEHESLRAQLRSGGSGVTYSLGHGEPPADPIPAGG